MILDGTKVLAIDDTPSIRAFLRMSLENEGAEFHEAANASEGISLCKKLHPDLVVLDLGLPDIDGLDVLPKIKQIQDSETGNSPSVIVLTVRKGRETIDEVYRRGADGYLSKPFLVEDLLDLITEELH